MFGVNYKPQMKGRKMNFTLCRVNTILKRIGLELKTPRTDGVIPIKKVNGKVVAAIHPITRKFWVKKREKQGTNGDFKIKPQPIESWNDIMVWGQEALSY